jgi:hypothetical protein
MRPSPAISVCVGSGPRARIRRDDHEYHDEFERFAKHARSRVLRRTSAGRRECMLRGRCCNQVERRDGVRMHCNICFAHTAKGAVLRLTGERSSHSPRQLAVRRTGACRSTVITSCGSNRVDQCASISEIVDADPAAQPSTAQAVRRKRHSRKNRYLLRRRQQVRQTASAAIDRAAGRDKMGTSGFRVSRSVSYT